MWLYNVHMCPFCSHMLKLSQMWVKLADTTNAQGAFLEKF